MLSRQFLKFGKQMTVFDLCKRWRAGETVVQHDSDLFLLGREQADILRALGDDLAPINRDYFTTLHAEGQVPLIMNYYSSALHGLIKRAHLAQTRQAMQGEFKHRMATHVRKTFDALAKEDDVDLVVAVTEAVIDFHLREFLGFDASRETIRTLAYFEDYFTMGLYLEPNQLDEYYDASAFAQPKRTFHSIVDRWHRATNFTHSSGVPTSFTSLDFFYNFSVAGSTNVAKGFVYGLKLLEEQGEHRKAPEAESMLKELLRFLPLVDNHVVPSFVTRRPTERGREQLAGAGYGSVWGHVYLFHALHHADPELFQNPDLFDPWRWSENRTTSNLMTFGVGSNACCGSRLAETWLYTLFEVWQPTFRLAAPINLQSAPFVDSVPRAQRLTSRTVIAFH